MKVVKNLDALFAALKDYGFDAWDIKQYLDDNKKHIVFQLVPEEVEMEAKFLRKRLQKQMGESMKLDEAKQILKKNGYQLVEDTETNDEEMDKFNSEWSSKFSDARVSDKTLINLNKKMQNTIDKHMDLEDKINNAKNFNAWNKKDEKTKIKLLKDLLDDGYDFHDDNPYSEQDIMGDFYDIDDLAKVYDEVVDTLEDLFERNDFGGDWDLWLLDHTTFILKDILNGKTAEQIIKKFKKYF